MDQHAHLNILDTHVWLWLMEGDPRLADAVVDELEQSASMGTLSVLTLSLWEVAMFEAAGRIRFLVPVDTWLSEALETPGLNLLEIDATMAAESVRLPEDFDGDAVDRLLVSAARTRNGVLYTADPAIIAYGERGWGHVHAVRVP